MKQSIASEARYRQRVVKYSLKNGVSKAADRFHLLIRLDMVKVL